MYINNINYNKKCLRESKVKVKGNDVVASYIVKLGLVALPTYHVILF